MASNADAFAPLKGRALLLAGLVLALSNFMVVLDTSIANVSIAHIAGSLGISTSQGTWIITSYAVAEAICVPLTGWLANRFGVVRIFTLGMLGFGLFSFLCGISNSLVMLVVFRIGQGLCGGPLMPLSQTLLMRIFPPEKRGQAMGLWAMTTVLAPISGPILGGVISDSWSWHWIFFINIPVALFCAYGARRFLARAETATTKVRVDTIGLALLVLWIGALQIILDIGREHDWFADTQIVVLAIIAVVGFAVFVAWELTEKNPIVDLRVFRHRGFTAAVVSLAFAFGTMFSAVVLIPQWLQINLGYTATDAGYVMAFMGLAALVMSPVVARLSGKVDPRILVTFGILWLGMTSTLRAGWTTDADFWTLAIPQMLQGIGMPFFFIPLTTIALGAVNPEETASAAGVMSFLRTMAIAVGTAVSTTLWANNTVVARSEMVGKLNSDEISQSLESAGFSLDQVRGLVEQSVAQESLTLALNHMFLLSACVFAFAATAIWFAPRPVREVDTSEAH